MKTKNKKLILDKWDEAIKLQPTRQCVSNPIIAKLYASAWDQWLPDMGGKGTYPEPKVAIPYSIKYFYMKIVLNCIYSCFFLWHVKILIINKSAF